MSSPWRTPPARQAQAWGRLVALLTDCTCGQMEFTDQGMTPICSANATPPLPIVTPGQVPADELRREVEAILAAVPSGELRSITAKPILKQLGGCLARRAGGG